MSVNVSFDKIIDKVFAGFKKITPALIAVALASGLILFLPQNVLEKMNLHNLSKEWRTIFGLVFLITDTLVFTILLSVIIQKINKYIKNKRLNTILEKKLKNLNMEQKKIIYEMMRNSAKSISLNDTSGNTIYLINNGFLYRPQQFISLEFDNNTYSNHTPQPWLIDLYNKKPELFK